MLTALEDAGLAWLDPLREGWSGRPFAVRLWNGDEWRSGAGSPAFTVVIGAPALLVRLPLGVDLASLGDAWVDGRLDVEGDLLAAFQLFEHAGTVAWPRAAAGAALRTIVRAGIRLPRLRTGARRFVSFARRTSLDRARAAVNFHYELPYPFFRLFLDEQDVYSCAYYRRADATLEQAQADKLEHVCRKLRLRHGDEMLDLGCGWGALAVHAARHHGARVLGITLSEAQARVAGARVARSGVGDRCRIEVRDFRELRGAERFDCIASVGAIEHVAGALQPAYFRRCFELLRPGGRMLNHGITAVPARPLAGGNAFVRRYIFPDHELVPVHATLAAAQAAGFEVRDVESLREHYQLTLAEWHRRLASSAGAASALVPRPVHRAFRVYLAGLSHHFGTGDLDIHQSLLAKSDAGASGLPLTRDDLYDRHS